jgi:hypothetical protein
MPSCISLAETIFMTYNLINSRILQSDNYEKNVEIVTYNPSDYEDNDEFDNYLHSYMPYLSLIRSTDNNLIYACGKDYLKITFDDNKLIIKVIETMRQVFDD